MANEWRDAQRISHSSLGEGNEVVVLIVVFVSVEFPVA
jgi:hypothetical protein